MIKTGTTLILRKRQELASIQTKMMVFSSFPSTPSGPSSEPSPLQKSTTTLPTSTSLTKTEMVKVATSLSISKLKVCTLCKSTKLLNDLLRTRDKTHTSTLALQLILVFGKTVQSRNFKVSCQIKELLSKNTT